MKFWRLHVSRRRSVIPRTFRSWSSRAGLQKCLTDFSQSIRTLIWVWIEYFLSRVIQNKTQPFKILKLHIGTTWIFQSSENAKVFIIILTTSKHQTIPQTFPAYSYMIIIKTKYCKYISQTILLTIYINIFIHFQHC